MFELTGSELLFYGGIVVMLASVLAAVLCGMVFAHTGKKLKEQLLEEYGKVRE